MLSRRRAKWVVDRALEERFGIRLKPRDLSESRRFRWFHLRHVPLLGGAAACGTKRVEAPVGRDAIEPGADRGAFLERCETLPCRQQGLLQSVLGILQGSKHPVAMGLQRSAVRFRQLTKCVAVPAPRPVDLFGRHASPSKYRHRASCKLGPPSFSTSWCLYQ